MPTLHLFHSLRWVEDPPYKLIRKRRRVGFLTHHNAVSRCVYGFRLPESVLSAWATSCPPYNYNGVD
ncbi:MAG: hypothetical protein IKG79_00770 [Neisseriaceae bacterium]|nr:hypothetical protein [Neisseriaceae bacterium]